MHQPGPFVPPGSGWPEDRATSGTPIARNATAARRLATDAVDLDELTALQSVCRACPRLVAWREEVAVTRRRAFAGETYWGRPVPGWGVGSPQLLIVGLAPAAHGGNRTGRIFTGDRSGDWLFAGLHRVGLAALPTSVRAGDGQHLLGARMVAAVRCAPPANKPEPVERDTCAPWLDRETALVLPGLRAVLALGAFGWGAALGSLGRLGIPVPRPAPRFGHEAEIQLRADPPLWLVGSFHPSQQNTFTGRLTEPMLDAALHRARRRAGLAPGRVSPDTA